MLISWYNKSKK